LAPKAQRQGSDAFRGKIRNDDETVLVLRRGKESRFLMLGKVAHSYTFSRLLRSMKRKRAKTQQHRASMPRPENS